MGKKEEGVVMTEKYIKEDKKDYLIRYKTTNVCDDRCPQLHNDETYCTLYKYHVNPMGIYVNKLRCQKCKAADIRSYMMESI